VSGHGIARRSIEGAVDRVLAALPAGMAQRDRARESLPAASDRAARPSPASGPAIVAVLSAASAPDLASRARGALERERLRVLALGTATAGRHTVLTVRLPAGSAPALERLAGELGASLTVLDSAAAAQVGA
jgi:hypothetical protein